MKLPRFRLRTMMILVAVAAVAIGGGLGWERERRRWHYRRWAEIYEETASRLNFQATQLEQAGGDRGDPGIEAWIRKRASDYRRHAARYEAAMEQQRDAASRAWPPPVWAPAPEGEWSPPKG